MTRRILMTTAALALLGACTAAQRETDCAIDDAIQPIAGPVEAVISALVPLAAPFIGGGHIGARVTCAVVEAK